MDNITYFIIFILLLALVIAMITIKSTIVFEYQLGLLYNRGKFVAILKPGQHFFFRPFHSVIKVDTRIFSVTIPGQEVLSADNVSIKVSLAANYRVADPYLAINRVANYQEALYLFLQLNLRDVVGSLAIDDLLAKREEIAKLLYEKSTTKCSDIGVELLAINIKDIMFPGELKSVFAQVVNARKEGLAALERARGESAALRNLANASNLLENNPNLLQLRLFQVLEKGSGNTVVLVPPEAVGVSKLLGKASTKSDP